MSLLNKKTLFCALALIVVILGCLVSLRPNASDHEAELSETLKKASTEAIVVAGELTESRSQAESVVHHSESEVHHSESSLATGSVATAPSQLRRGANNRLLLEEAVVTPRHANPTAVSSEIIFSARNATIAGPLTVDAHTLTAIEATVDLAALHSFLESNDGAFRLPLSQDREILATFDRVVTRGAHTTTLIGQVVNDSFSDILLVFHDGAVHGSIAFHDTNIHYQLTSAGNGDVAIRQLDTHSFDGGCGQPEALAGDVAVFTPEASSEDTSEGEVLRSPSGTSPFDIVVGYSAEARQSDGGTATIEARIIASVDRLNLAISNSEAGDWFCSLLAMIEDPDPTFTDADYSDMNDILIDLRQTTNGPLDAVTDLQQELGADQATFICDNVISGTSGIAGRPGVYAIVARTYMTSTRITFAHEMGHNLGLRHAWGDTTGTNANPKNQSNYGWRFAAATNGKNLRTIMAYGNGWPSNSRIPYFSNPDVSYNGALTGAVDGFDATDTSASPAYDQQLVADGIVGGLGSGFDGTNASLGARNGHYLFSNSGVLANKDTREALAVLEPVANAAFDEGATTTIYWHGGDHSDSVDIALYKGGVFQFTIESGISGEARWYDWTVPTVTYGDDYTIRVTLNGSVFDDSGTFSMGRPAERLPYYEGFETDTGNWLQAYDDDYDWTRHTGGTDSPAAGPDGASNGSYYMYAEGHDAGGSYKTASMQCTFDFSVVRETTLSFDYHMYGAYIDYLAVDIHDGTSWTNDVWIKDSPQHSSSSDAWSSASIDLSAYTGNGEVTIRFRTANLQWNSADPAVDEIRIDVGPMSLPYAESFEDGLAAWAQSTDDDFDWTVHSGGTSTGSTGPSGASDGIQYLYTEPHDIYNGHNKIAQIDCMFDLSVVAAAELRFDYHMYGGNIDYLAVDVHDGSTWATDVWKRTDAQHSSSEDPWSNAVVNLSSYAGNGTVTIRFRAKQKYWHVADIALDNVKVFEPVSPLVAHWSMEDGSGAVVTDDTGNGFEGTMVNASWVSGISGSALEFNGSNSTVILPAATFASISEEITISMWVFGGDDQPREDSVFYALNVTGDRVLNVHLPFGDGKVYWDAGFDSTFDRMSQTAAPDQYKGQWNHWVFTKNASTGDMGIYLNGELWLSETGHTRSMAGITAAALGSQISGMNYSGTIDDVRIYNVSLDATTVWDLFTSYTTVNGVPFGWLMSHGIDPSEAGAMADTDADNYINELEWIFGTDPLVGDSPIKTLSTSEAVMSITYTRRKLDDVSVYAVWSPDLTELSWGTTGLSEVVTADDGEIETVTVTLPMDADQKFIQVRVDQ